MIAVNQIKGGDWEGVVIRTAQDKVIVVEGPCSQCQTKHMVTLQGTDSLNPSDGFEFFDCGNKEECETNMALNALADPAGKAKRDAEKERKKLDDLTRSMLGQWTSSQIYTSPFADSSSTWFDVTGSSQAITQKGTSTRSATSSKKSKKPLTSSTSGS